MALVDEKTHAINASEKAIDATLGQADDQLDVKAKLLGCSVQDYLDAEEYSKTLSLKDAASVGIYPK